MSKAGMKGPRGVGTDVEVRAGTVVLGGTLTVPDDALGLVLFAHGSGSSRKSPRNVFVAEVLQRARIATLLFDLLTRDEEAVDVVTREYRFDIPLLARRLSEATRWVVASGEPSAARLGYFGASTGSAAALIAAAEPGSEVRAVVSRGGRPDLAAEALPAVRAATLLIVGGDDDVVLDLNRQALAALRCEKRLAIVPGATHLFEEPGALETVAEQAADWFCEHMPA